MREDVELLVLSVKLAFMSAPDPTKTVFLVTSKLNAEGDDRPRET